MIHSTTVWRTSILRFVRFHVLLRNVDARNVGRTCWWLDAEDGGGTGGRGNLLRTYATHMSPKLY